MNRQPISRARIVVAAMVPFAILALVGLGLTVYQTHLLSSWERAEAAYVGSEHVVLTRGDSADHSFSQRHYRFVKKDGAEVQLYFLERGASPEKTMGVLYDPDVSGQITRSEGDARLWDRASNVHAFLFAGLGMSAVGLLGCVVGAALLIFVARMPAAASGLRPAD